MSSLFDSLRNKGNEVSPTVANIPTTQSKMKGAYAASVERWKQETINNYYNHSIDLNKSIARIAEANNLNNEQISRIIEEVNCEIYVIEYDKLKNSTVRDVDFNIASLQKIKDMLDNNTKANLEPVKLPGDTSKSEEPTMKKKASYFNEDGGDPLNAFNYTAYETVGLSANTNITDKTILHNKMIDKCASIAKEAEEIRYAYVESVDTMATAFIKYAQAGCDTGNIFEKMCQDSGLLKRYQIPLIAATQEKLAAMKESKSISNQLTVDIGLVNSEKPVNEFSLGLNSLMKQASDVDSNKELPTVTTDKQTIRNARDLIELAKKIKQNHENLKTITEKKDKIDSVLSNNQ